MTSSKSHDPYASLRYSAFRYILTARFLANFSLQMTETVLGWHMYEKTNSPFVLGFVGLLEIAPVLLFSLYAGTLADKYNRQKMAGYAQCGFLAAALLLTACSYLDTPISVIYFAILLMGTARAFNFPATATLLVQAVPANLYTNAAAWNSNCWQLSAVLGPMTGGILIATTKTPTPAYAIASVLLMVAIISLFSMKLMKMPSAKPSQKGILEGVYFLKKSPLLLSIISLDLFAVLLGGAVALLPIYARDILHVGPSGLGWLRAAPSIGSTFAALYIAHRRPFQETGKTLLYAVGGFGVATIIFGLSTSFILSLCMLCISGVCDSISAVIRSTLLLVLTPDHLRGRISAINSIFIGASNELGAFESGSVAHAFGSVFSVVSGGIGTIVVVLLTAVFSPQLRKFKTLDVQKEENIDPA